MNFLQTSSPKRGQSSSLGKPAQTIQTFPRRGIAKVRLHCGKEQLKFGLPSRSCRSHLLDEPAVAATVASLGVSEAEVHDRAGRLICLVPGLESKLKRLHTSILVGMLGDLRSVSNRMVELKILMPSADVGAMVATRPSIVLDPEWDNIAKGMEILAAIVPADSNVDYLAQQQPLLVTGDLRAAIAELNRLLPGSDAGELIQQNPQIILSVMDNSVLSLW